MVGDLIIIYISVLVSVDLHISQKWDLRHEARMHHFSILDTCKTYMKTRSVLLYLAMTQCISGKLYSICGFRQLHGTTIPSTCYYGGCSTLIARAVAPISHDSSMSHASGFSASTTMLRECFLRAQIGCNVCGPQHPINSV